MPDFFLHAALELREAGEKGRGVFTSAPLGSGEVIECSPVIVHRPEERKLLEATRLHDYIFEWGKALDHCAVGLGYLSLYNHASPANCEYLMHFEERIITVITMRPIAAGEELYINYSADWDEKKPVWFDMK